MVNFPEHNRISTVGGNESVDYKIELTGNDLVKYYTDSAYTNLIENNIYKVIILFII